MRLADLRPFRNFHPRETPMKRSFASLSILAASISLLHASPVFAAGDSMTKIRTKTSAPADTSATSRVVARSSHDAGKQRVTPRQDLVSLNPQPLPPVETGRRPAATGKDKALTTGIIIVGGKNAIAR